ncbi:MAG: site-specific integrase [Candidatus Undinarchaeales archaeon]
MGDIHNYDQRLKSAVRRLKEDKKIPQKNKDLILEFKEDCEAENLSTCRVEFYLIRLRNIAKYLGKKFTKTTRKDLKKLVVYINKECDYTAKTKHDYKTAVKKFYRWMGKGDLFYDGKHPGKRRDEDLWLTTTLKKNNRKLPQDMWSKKSIRKMVRDATRPMDKAVGSVIYESGTRAGEFLGIDIKHITWVKHGIKVFVQGKTGERKIKLIEGVSHLKNWLDNHPQKDNRNAPLWMNINNGLKRRKNESTQEYKRRTQKRLSYRGLRSLLQRMSANAGFGTIRTNENGNEIYEGKAVNPHIFRHSRATYDAKFLTDRQMCMKYGWSPGSKMPGKYSHLSGRDLDDVIDKQHGIETEEEKEERLICSRCGRENPEGSQFCNCGMPLSLKASMEVEQKKAKLNSKLGNFMELLEDDEVKEVLARKLANRADFS